MRNQPKNESWMQLASELWLRLDDRRPALLLDTGTPCRSHGACQAYLSAHYATARIASAWWTDDHGNARAEVAS